MTFAIKACLEPNPFGLLADSAIVAVRPDEPLSLDLTHNQLTTAYGPPFTRSIPLPSGRHNGDIHLTYDDMIKRRVAFVIDDHTLPFDNLFAAALVALAATQPDHLPVRDVVIAPFQARKIFGVYTDPERMLMSMAQALRVINSRDNTPSISTVIVSLNPYSFPSDIDPIEVFNRSLTEK